LIFDRNYSIIRKDNGSDNMNEDYISFIKEKLKCNVDLKVRELSCRKGNISIMYIDNLCDPKFISQHIIEPIINEKDNIETVADLKFEGMYTGEKSNTCGCF
jgi:hypothetical protein